jgi:hypothetical protein
MRGATRKLLLRRSRASKGCTGCCGRSRTLRERSSTKRPARRSRSTDPATACAAAKQPRASRGSDTGAGERRGSRRYVLARCGSRALQAPSDEPGLRSLLPWTTKSNLAGAALTIFCATCASHLGWRETPPQCPRRACASAAVWRPRRGSGAQRWWIPVTAARRAVHGPRIRRRDGVRGRSVPRGRGCSRWRRAR